MASIYLRLSNLLDAFCREGDGPEEWEGDRILLHLFSLKGKPATVGELLRTQSFGTLPTLQKRLRRLLRLGLVSAVVGEDRRTRVISMTDAGSDHLQARGRRLQEALKQST